MFAGETNMLCWDMEAFSLYTKLQDKLKTTEEACKVLASTPEVSEIVGSSVLNIAVCLPVGAKHLSETQSEYLLY